jgi:hypothetical protein
MNDMSEDFKNHMVENYSVVIICGYCGFEVEVESSGAFFESAAAELNSILNKSKWILENDVPTCSDCQKVAPEKRGSWL